MAISPLAGHAPEQRPLADLVRADDQVVYDLRVAQGAGGQVSRASASAPGVLALRPGTCESGCPAAPR